MKIDVVTLFPEMVDKPLSLSIIGRAREKGLLKINCVNPRDFPEDKHRTVDSKPYGGGSGMVMMVEPLYKAISKVKKRNSYVVLLTPRGRVFNQSVAKELLTKKHIVLVCGHYEGFDERISYYADDEISIGDFVLSGGEPAAVCIIDSVGRLVDGVIKKESREEESFKDYLLEFPQYARPAVWKGKKVPDLLLSGDHNKIKKWRFEKSLEITKKRRPDLYEKYRDFLRRKDE
ncbi:MAG TPA: tRNA (guanosine(37)-N1)-methyltransferase TrmD [Elusimicrobiales bacterium]|nr:tRNA (guanosine(37)-N1)-methyltransferase TrmD [Elusimicrobiales bacterium]